MMELFLSRGRDGKYMLTKYRPIKALIPELGREDFYVQPGDPIGYRGLCPEGTLALGLAQHLRRLETIKIRAYLEVISEDS